VHAELAAQVALPEERRQRPAEGGLDLALVLAQLGRDEREADGREDLRLRGAPRMRRSPRRTKMPCSLILSPMRLPRTRMAMLCRFER